MTSRKRCGPPHGRTVEMTLDALGAVTATWIVFYDAVGDPNCVLQKSVAFDQHPGHQLELCLEQGNPVIPLF